MTVDNCNSGSGSKWQALEAYSNADEIGYTICFISIAPTVAVFDGPSAGSGALQSANLGCVSSYAVENCCATRNSMRVWE